MTLRLPEIFVRLEPVPAAMTLKRDWITVMNSSNSGWGKTHLIDHSKTAGGFVEFNGGARQLVWMLATVCSPWGYPSHQFGSFYDHEIYKLPLRDLTNRYSFLNPIESDNVCKRCRAYLAQKD